MPPKFAHLVQKIAAATIVAGILSSCLQTGAPQRPQQSEAPTATPEVLALWQECAICHGTGEMQRGSILDGLPAWYLDAQLDKFARGIRGKNPANRAELLMGGAIDKIPSVEMREQLAAHIATLPAPEHIRVVKGELAKGQALYQARCAACHGADAEGNRELAAPPLAILEDWYLADQIRKFADNRRAHHPDDLAGKQMAAASQDLSPTDIRDLAAFLAAKKAP